MSDPEDRREFQNQWSAAFTPRQTWPAHGPSDPRPPRGDNGSNGGGGGGGEGRRDDGGRPAGPIVEYEATDEQRQRDRQLEGRRGVGFHATLLALTPRVVVTPLLVALNVLVFAVMVFRGVSATDPSVPDLLNWGANFGPLTVGHNQWWRLLTCTFLHIGMTHIFMNMLVLVLVGPFVERLLGHTGFLIAYLAAGLAGSLTSTWWNPGITGAGASGAIFGLYGVLIGFIVLRRDTIPRGVLSSLLRSAVLFVGLNVLIGPALKANIDNSAHIGGLLGGLVMGLVLSQPLDVENGRQRRRVRNGIAVLLAVTLVGGGVGLIRQRSAHSDGADWAKYLSSLSNLDNLAAYDLRFTHYDARLNEDVSLQSWKKLRPQVAEVLRLQVLPEWRFLADRLPGRSTQSLTPQQANRLQLLQRYAQLRQAQWQAWVESIEGNDPARQKQARWTARENEEAADELRPQLDVLLGPSKAYKPPGNDRAPTEGVPPAPGPEQENPDGKQDGRDVRTPSERQPLHRKKFPTA